MSARGAVTCISGGVDSVTTAYYVARRVRPSWHLLVFCNYGQRTYPYEEWCIRRVATDLSVGYEIIDLSWLGRLSTSLLTRGDQPIPETPPDDLWNPEKARQRILRWWDVVRNLQLITVALAHAESQDLRSYLVTQERAPADVYIGIRRETPVAMKDNTPEFIAEMNRVAEVATHFGGYRVHAPLISYDKDQVVKLGAELRVPWRFTYSCYAGAGFKREDGEEVPVHCGRCSNCRRRQQAFRDGGVTDPSVYAA